MESDFGILGAELFFTQSGCDAIHFAFQKTSPVVPMDPSSNTAQLSALTYLNIGLL